MATPELTILSLTFAYGVLAGGVSLSMLIFFARTKKPLSHAVAFMLTGEFIAMAFTTFFAYMDLTGQDVKMSVVQNSGVRAVMFTSVMISTIHLSYQVRRITHETK